MDCKGKDGKGKMGGKSTIAIVIATPKKKQAQTSKGKKK